MSPSRQALWDGKSSDGPISDAEGMLELFWLLLAVYTSVLLLIPFMRRVRAGQSRRRSAESRKDNPIAAARDWRGGAPGTETLMIACCSAVLPSTRSLQLPPLLRMVVG